MTGFLKTVSILCINSRKCMTFRTPKEKNKKRKIRKGKNTDKIQNEQNCNIITLQVKL